MTPARVVVGKNINSATEKASEFPKGKHVERLKI